MSMKERDLAIARLVRRGYSQARVARGFNLSTTRVRDIYRRHERKVAHHDCRMFRAGPLFLPLEIILSAQQDALDAALDARWAQLEAM